MDCLQHALAPKTYVREKYPSIVNEYGVWGKFETLVADNGLEFHCDDLEAVCKQLKIDLDFNPPYHPWYKGVVERFFRTINEDLLHDLTCAT